MMHGRVDANINGVVSNLSLQAMLRMDKKKTNSQDKYPGKSTMAEHMYKDKHPRFLYELYHPYGMFTAL